MSEEFGQLMATGGPPKPERPPLTTSHWYCCPECGSQDIDEDVWDEEGQCRNCGCDWRSPHPFVWAAKIVEHVKRRLKEMNINLTFHFGRKNEVLLSIVILSPIRKEFLRILPHELSIELDRWDAKCKAEDPDL